MNRCGNMTIRIRHITRGCIWDSHFEGRGGHRSYHWKERWWFPIRSLPIVTIALSLTIQPQFAIECLRRIIQQGTWVTLGQCSLWSRSVMLGSAESENPRLTNCEIIHNLYTVLPHFSTDARKYFFSNRVDH